MNKIVAYAKEKNMFGGYIPELEVEEIVELNDVWDGNGESPLDYTLSCSYLFYRSEGGNEEYINYEFEILEEKENELDTVIKITEIRLL